MFDKAECAISRVALPTGLFDVAGEPGASALRLMDNPG
jgi:hypothetical protein